MPFIEEFLGGFFFFFFIILPIYVFFFYAHLNQFHGEAPAEFLIGVVVTVVYALPYIWIGKFPGNIGDDVLLAGWVCLCGLGCINYFFSFFSLFIGFWLILSISSISFCCFTYLAVVIGYGLFLGIVYWRFLHLYLSGFFVSLFTFLLSILLLLVSGWHNQDLNLLSINGNWAEDLKLYEGVFFVSFSSYFVFANKGIVFPSIVNFPAALKYNFFFFEWNSFPYIFFDSFSICFILLSTFIIVICFLLTPQPFFLRFSLSFLFLFIEFMLVFSFATASLFWFYFFFEGLLFLMYFLIGLFGSRTRRIHANYFFFMYTIVLSLFMLYGLLLLWAVVGSVDYWSILFFSFSAELEKTLWVCIFLTFIGKIPLFPVYSWLPEAHVEAPTSGSVILASLLLKLGGYGCLRFLVFLFPNSCIFFWPLVCTLCTVSFFYTSFAALTQLDLKRMIAYSSITHMSLVVLGLFSLTHTGIQASTIMMLSHGLTSAGLFFLIGALYDRYHTRLVTHYGGLATTMPIFSIFFFLFLLCNIGFPGTLNFTGEFLLLYSLWSKSFLFLFLYVFNFLVNIIFSFWLFNRLCFGALSRNSLFFIDLTFREYWVLFFLVFIILFFGINSKFFGFFFINSILFWL